MGIPGCSSLQPELVQKMRLGAVKALLLRFMLLLPFLLLERSESAGGISELWARNQRPQTNCSVGGLNKFDEGLSLTDFSSSWSGNFGSSNLSAFGVCPVVAASSCSAEDCGLSQQEHLGAGSVRVVGEVADEFIVRFREYKYAFEHKEGLKCVLDEYGWQWVDRVNPAAVLPTDFGLLRVSKDWKLKILDQLANADSVKDVSPQMQFTRGLASGRVSDEEADVSLHEKQDLAYFQEQRSGRFTTRSSYSDYLETEGGGHYSLRHLLSQVQRNAALELNQA